MFRVLSPPFLGEGRGTELTSEYWWGSYRVEFFSQFLFPFQNFVLSFHFTTFFPTFYWYFTPLNHRSSARITKLVNFLSP